VRVFVAAASLAVILAASAGAAPPASGGGGKEKPSAITAKGQTLVVDANMKLAWDAAATTRGPGAAAGWRDGCWLRFRIATASRRHPTWCCCRR
jgi:hypothetical protein